VLKKIFKLGTTIGLLFSYSAIAANNCIDMPESGGVYNIVNEGSGLYMDIAGASQDNGANVLQWSGNTQKNQQFTLTKLDDGYWSIRAAHSQKSIDLYDWNKENDSSIKQWDYWEGDVQKWTLKSSETGGIKITSGYTQKLVTVANSDKGADVYQSADKSSAYQRWYFNPVNGECSSKNFMDSEKLLIGSINTATAKKLPLDVEYQYINNVAPMAECMNSCKADSSCSSWWGCWQWDERPPASKYPGDFIKELENLSYDNQEHPQMTSWTYYSLLSLAGNEEGEAEINILRDSTILKRYFDDYRFLLKKLGNARTLLHIEPDFWGFVRSSGVNNNPKTIPAKVNEANPTDCPANAYDNTVSGMARCMIAMTHKYAPNAAVGLHVSPWNFKTKGDADKVADFMIALGAGEGDFIVTDPADRDAGYYETVKNESWHWWNKEDLAAYLSWSKTLSERVGKPTIMWQIPLGNSWQNNTELHYRDNKVELLFENINDVASAHVVGLFFGGGEETQTNIDTDYNMFSKKVTDYWKSGGATLK
jgi:hypothetical protein